jgi:hypothetical protein
VKRLPFTHYMLSKIEAGDKKQTSRMNARKYEQGEWVLASCNWFVQRGMKADPRYYHELKHHVAMAIQGTGGRPAYSPPAGWVLKPSIHMPSWLCQFALRIESTRLERLDSITEDDAKAEGFEGVDTFMQYFHLLNPKGDTGAEVQVVTFQAYEIEKAAAMGGLANLVLNQQSHWHEDWREYIPRWMMPMQVEVNQ